MSDNIFLDFDGTLIDSKERLYRLFCDLVLSNEISFDEYWKIKGSGLTQSEMLKKYFNYSDARLKNFRHEWLREVESVDRLDTDAPLPGISDVLKNLSELKKVYLVTARQNRTAVDNQLKLFGWKNYFQDVLVTCQSVSKSSLILKTISPNIFDFFIGDTGEDINAGKSLGVKTIAVASGVINKDLLSTYNPDYILDGLAEDKEKFFEIIGI